MHFHLPRVKSLTNIVDQVRDVIKQYRHEKESEAHQIFRGAAGHQPKGVVPQTVNPDEETVPGIEHPGSTGVIYCSDRAMANGFSYANSHEWANLGQGAPEVGPIPNAPPRPTSIPIPTDSLEYAPTTGVKALREAVANLYNETYRSDKASKYTFENVCIVPGGRSGLSRVAAVIGDVYTVGAISDNTLTCFYIPASQSFQIPDYTAYDQVLSAFKRLTQGLAVILASNPRNPTGQVIKGNDLKELVALGHEGTTVILDEFYSWYIYPNNEHDYGKSVSAAKYVENVNEDSTIIIDGLTKVFLLMFYRPKKLPSYGCYRTGVFLGGELQLAAIPLLDPSLVALEKVALQKHFKAKRDHVLSRLHALGLDVDIPPNSTFYIWLNLEKLPEPLNNGLVFFEELLKHKTIVIPGIFFDINPAHRRNLFNSPCHHFVRLSFGPPIEDLDRGLDAIGQVLQKARKTGTRQMGHGYKKSVDITLDTQVPNVNGSLSPVTPTFAKV
ncbi:hypothetical protein C0995_007183 [Termitomyces sp. Mi166|nr:hypothetical protein C0995_007183 [Termitomyces sp. Mi166\